MLDIHMYGVRDSMGCYFAGEILNGSEIEGIASADDLATLFDMLLELYRDCCERQPVTR